LDEPVIMRLSMYITASEYISTSYFINTSHQSVCLCVPLIVARQRLCKNVSAAMGNNNRRTAECVDFIRSMSYHRKVGDELFPEILAF
jgi:hypothetical protein